MLIRSGTEGFTFERGPWSVLGSGALGALGTLSLGEQYMPDFDAVAVAACRLLRISRAAYLAALRAAQASVAIGECSLFA